jgi:hypothetical protein
MSRLALRAKFLKVFNPAQQRDERGRWSTSGGPSLVVTKRPVNESPEEDEDEFGNPIPKTKTPKVRKPAVSAIPKPKEPMSQADKDAKNRELLRALFQKGTRIPKDKIPTHEDAIEKYGHACDPKSVVFGDGTTFADLPKIRGWNLSTKSQSIKSFLAHAGIEPSSYSDKELAFMNVQLGVSDDPPVPEATYSKTYKTKDGRAIGVSISCNEKMAKIIAGKSVGHLVHDVDVLMQNDPPPPQTTPDGGGLRVVVQDCQHLLEPGQGGAVGAYCIRSAGLIGVDPTTMNNSEMAIFSNIPAYTNTSRGLLLPWAPKNATKTSLLQYTIAHEWGHLTDVVHEATRGGDAYPEMSDVKQLLEDNPCSRYAQFNTSETLAEAYADWRIDPDSAHSTTKKIAKALKWGKSLKMKRRAPTPSMLLLAEKHGHTVDREKNVVL